MDNLDQEESIKIFEYQVSKKKKLKRNKHPKDTQNHTKKGVGKSVTKKPVPTTKKPRNQKETPGVAGAPYG